MGEPTPAEMPEIDPVGWYKATVNYYVDHGLLLGCEGAYIDTRFCVIAGEHIISWLSGGFECVSGHCLCTHTDWGAEKLIDIEVVG